MIIGAIHARGFFGDIWNTVGNVAGNVWDGVSNTAVNAWNGVTNFGQYVASVAVESFNNVVTTLDVVKQFAIAFIQGGIHTAQMATQQAAQEFIDFLAPYAQDLGLLWDQTVAQLTSVWNGLTIPTWESRAILV